MDTIGWQDQDMRKLVIEVKVEYKPNWFEKLLGAKAGQGIRTREVEPTVYGLSPISDEHVSAMEGPGALDIYSMIIKSSERIDARRK